MNKQLLIHPIDAQITLDKSSHLPLSFQVLFISITPQDEEIIDCHITFQVSPTLYNRIDTEALFNLKPEVRTPLTNGDFQPSPDIQIETLLKPDSPPSY